MRKKLLYLIPCFLLWLGIFGASFSLDSYAADVYYPSPTTPERYPIVFHNGNYYIYSEAYSYMYFDSAGRLYSALPDGRNVGVYQTRFWYNYSWLDNGYGTYSGLSFSNCIAGANLIYPSYEAARAAANSNSSIYPPQSIYDDSLLLNPKWVYMTGNGMLILNPSANVSSVDITLHNLTTGSSFDYSSGSGQVPIFFDSNIASIGDRIQFEMIPKDSQGNYGNTYYLAQTLDIFNLTTIDTVVSRPYVPVSVPDSSGSGNTVINVPVSGTTSYTVYNNNPVTNVSSNPVTNYVISADYSNTEYNQETIEIINQYIVNNYENTSNQVVNNYVYYETNNNIDIDISITSIQQTFNDIKSLGFNLLNFFTNIRIIFTDAFGFLPAWLIALIFAGFVLIIVLVIAKLILLIL